MTEEQFIRATGGQRYWSNRPTKNEDLAHAVMCKLRSFRNRCKYNFYLTKNHYRLIRSDAEAVNHPLLEVKEHIMLTKSTAFDVVRQFLKSV